MRTSGLSTYRLEILNIESRIYDITRLEGQDIFYDYAEFDIINKDRRRVLSFSIFLDELATVSERKGACPIYCGCAACYELKNLEAMYLLSYGADYPEWNVDLKSVLSPRAFKFTERSQVSFNKRPESYNKPSVFVNKTELSYIFQTINDILKIHRSVTSSLPYVAFPANTLVDSIYKKVLDKRLPVNLSFNVVRLEKSSNSGNSIYVVQ